MKLVIPNFYEKALSLFGHRLQIKHKIYGLEHRTRMFNDLKFKLDAEVHELQAEIEVMEQDPQSYNDNQMTKLIDEALDVMICGMIIVDRALQELKGAEH